MANLLLSMLSAPGYNQRPTQSLSPDDAPQADDALNLAGLQDQRRSELEDNMATTDPGSMDYSRLKSLFGTLNNDIQESPLSRQRDQVQQTEDANQGAMLKGFLGGKLSDTGESMSPSQQAGQFQNQLDIAKVNSPVAVARASHEQDVPVEQIRAKGVVDAANERATAYQGRSVSNERIAVEKDLNALKIAQSRNPQASAAIAQAEHALDLINERMVANRDDKDPTSLAQIDAIKARILQYQTPPGQGQAPAATPTSGARIRVVGPNGEKGTVDASEQLPAGWTAVGQ